MATKIRMVHPELGERAVDTEADAVKLEWRGYVRAKNADPAPAPDLAPDKVKK